jgi:hypothetical protein
VPAAILPTRLGPRDAPGCARVRHNLGTSSVLAKFTDGQLFEMNGGLNHRHQDFQTEALFAAAQSRSVVLTSSQPPGAAERTRPAPLGCMGWKARTLQEP